MKGIIMQKKGEKSVVLFNNGKIGEIPTPPNSEEGTVISLSYNKLMLTAVSFLFIALLLCTLFYFIFSYNKPAGFIQINYQSASIELTYNRFRRVLAARPLNIPAVEPLTVLRLKNKKAETAYQMIMQSLAPLEPSATRALVRIAQDNLIKAKNVELRLSETDSYPTVIFEIYTHELYQQVISSLPAVPPMPPPPARPQGGRRPRMMNREMGMSDNPEHHNNRRRR